ncbi:MAG TPA: DUF4097 family beta strand repeat-containing protein [Mycobacteriales bacterium]|jgi:hypothetical protein|nr:DUF4097 family beta strand repeat-containing protein [Mycobacteriales bacterium]
MIDKRFATPRPVRLDVKLAIADVEIRTVDGTESSVTITGTERLLDLITVDLVGDRLLIEMKHKIFGGWGQRWGSIDVQVTVTVPHHSEVRIACAAGDAFIDGTLACLDIKGASGQLRATGEIVGDATVKTVSGDIRLPRIGGDLTAGTVAGDVFADSVSGSVTAKSVSGDIRLGSVQAGQVKVHCVSGDVEIGIAVGSNVDVDATSTSGSLSSEVPLASAPRGDGAPTVVVRGKTVSGDVRVFRAA